MKDKLRITAGFCIALSAILGFLRSMDLIEHEYLRHRLYGTALRTLALNMDRQLLILLTACAAIYAVYMLGRVRRRLAAPIFRFAGIIAIASVSLTALQIRPLLTGRLAFAGQAADAAISVWWGVIESTRVIFSRTTVQDASLTDDLRLALAVVLVAAGAAVIRRHRKQLGESVCTAEPEHDRTLLGRKKGAVGASPVFLHLFSIPFVLVFTAVNLGAAGFWSWNAVTMRNRPNVILIIMDTVRADHLGCYGYERNTTPRIDGLARRGLVFTNAVSQAPWTPPSICSIVTGRYPESLGLSTDLAQIRLSDENLTMAEIMKERGYITGAVVSSQVLSKRMNLVQGYDSYSEFASKPEVSSNLVTANALGRMRGFGGKRFFLTLHYMDPHSPYVLHGNYDFFPEYQGKYPNRMHIRGRTDLRGCSEEDLKHAQALYDSDIRYTDESIGLLMTGLRRLGLSENTLIIIVSDHGEEFLEHGFCNHGHSLYEELTRVPCIIKLPGELTEGRKVEEPFPLVNMLPSVLEYLGIAPSPYGLHGTALDLRNPGRTLEQPIFSAHDGAGPRDEPVSLRSVQLRGLKYIRDFVSGREWLFDLTRDPGEKNSIAARQPTAVRNLREMLEKHKERMDSRIHSAKTAPSPALNPEEAEKLRSLGYLH